MIQIWTMTSNSVIQNEEHDIASHILKTILDCMTQLFFRPQYVWFLVQLYVDVISNSGGELAEVIVYIIPIELDDGQLKVNTKTWNHWPFFWSNCHPNVQNINTLRT